MMVYLLIALFLGSAAHAGEWKRNGATLSFSGQIIEGEFARFSAAYDENVKTLTLDSPGGLIAEGLKIGQVLAAGNVTVEARGLCMSSCANYLFLAGKRRILAGGIVGFHGDQAAFLAAMEKMVEGLSPDIALQVWKVNLELDPASTDAEIRQGIEAAKQRAAAEKALFEKLGVSQALFDRAELADKGKGDGGSYYMWLPTKQSFKKYGVDVEGEQSRAFLDSDPRVKAARDAGRVLLVD